MHILTSSRAQAALVALLCLLASSNAFMPTVSPSLSTRTCGHSSHSAGPALVGSSFTAHKVALRAPTAPRGAAKTAVRMAVNVKVEDMPNSVKKLEIEVTADECQNAFQAVLSKLSKQADIPGFRKGKAPAAMVLNHFGKKSVTAEACEEIIGAAVPVALQQNDIRAIGQAKMADENAIEKMLETFGPEQSVAFEVLVDVWPEPELKGSYTGMTVEAEKEEFEDDLVANALFEMRKREAGTEDSEGDTVATIYGARLGDDTPDRATGAVAVVDLKGFKKNDDGSKGDALPDIAVGDNVEVTMESGKFFEGFVESIEGMKAGDTRAVPITFPENHKVPELRGLEAMFDVTIKGLKDKIYPTLNDEWAAKVSECKTMEELKERIRAQVSQEQLVSTDKNVVRSLENELVEMVDVEIPETLVDEQTKSKFAQMMSDFKEKGMDDEMVKSMITKENYEKYKKKSRDNTVRSLKISFVVGEIAKKEGIKVDPSEVEGEMVAIRQQLQGDEIDEESARNRVEADLERKKVMNFLKENNTINLIPKKKEEEEDESAAE